MTDEQRDQDVEIETTDSYDRREAPLYGVGPFTVRELALIGVWLVAFVVSFFSIYSDRRFALLVDGASVWTSGLEWVLTIGVPTVAVFLIVLRRFSPEGIRRVGSLGVDQFASVAFSVAAVVWLVWLWSNVATAITTGVWIYSWVVWVEFFLMLLGVVLTVFAPYIPPFDQDFQGRPEVPAHRNARPVRAVTPRPAPVRPPAEPTSDDLGVQSGEAGAPAAVLASEYEDGPAYARHDEPTLVDQPVSAEPEWAPTQSRDTFEAVPHERQQAFWALAPEERDVVDEAGIPIFRIGPTAWALVIEDRGNVFVVRHEDGRIGYLRNVSGITRG